MTPEDVRILVPGAYKNVTLHGKTAFADMILRWGEDPALSGGRGARVITRVFLRGRSVTEEGARTTEAESEI